ncbi:MAG: OadG family protein [Melioribacteraceae bacterium]|jgi:Na+-transporting methylmalonyl-CoA/oxaloacetate decarboxylase gamma subunit|nr:OadG family protein [Melioribacteraceae bacterium]WKZ68808.1 MAG: OadG family protein [Melioribacteraceae bacterium]
MNEIVQQSDTLQAIKDSVASTVNSVSGELPDLHFTLENITQDSLIITVLGYTIVFLSLLFLFVVFLNITKIINYNVRKKLKESGKLTEENNEVSISGEVTAAISMALVLHFREVHDFESTIITIKKVQRPYSPWSSKIYGLRQYPGKR